MKLYHYTTIETLALIIKNRTIRFNRLDNVDDCEESMYGSGPAKTKLGQYTFVSCWTRNAQENISLWNMYTNNKGVRIGLDEDMFVTYPFGDKRTFFQNDVIIGNAIISNFINFAEVYDVEYVQDQEGQIKNLVEPIGHLDVFHTDKVGIYKKEEWAFQQECRFKITAMPIPKDGSHSNPFNLMKSIGLSLNTNTPISAQYIDISLDDNKLQSLEVMMGPKTSYGDRIIVEALTSSLKNVKIRNSYFMGKLRDKA